MYSSKQLIEMINSGQGTRKYHLALTHIYQKHKKEFTNRLKGGKYQLSAAMALDIFHHAIVILVQKIQAQQQIDKNIAAFLSGICHHLFLQHQDRNFRKRKNEAKYSAELPPDLAENLGEIRLNDEAYRELMEGLFKSLGEKCQKILLWRQMNYSYREIAQKLSPSTPSSDNVIRVTAGRCLKKMIHLVEQQPALKKQIKDLLNP